MTPGATLPEPHRGIRALAQRGLFQADDHDPQMLWTPSPVERAALKSSPAVRVTVAMQAVEGVLSAPCIFVDWGDGFTEDSQRALTLSAPGVFTTLAQSNAGALRRIRFDPSSGPCVFAVSDFQVEAVSTLLTPVPRLSFVRRLARKGLRRTPVAFQNGLRAVRGFLTGGSEHRRAVISKGLRSLAWGADPWRTVYNHAFDVARNLRSPHFAAPPLSPPARDPDGAKVIAFYLPQYHPIPENDAWWGPGFTEWTNVSKAMPQFTGHVQPRHPADLGYYDLRVPEVRRAQADLAARTGVDAFCFHYYWFGGQRLLEQPLNAFVADETITTSFALSWANENWTRRWDGQESDILIGQNHSPQDDIAAFDDLARYMASPRYLRIGGRPFLAIYRPDALPDAKATTDRWRQRARALGIGEIFLVCTNAFGFADYRESGFDGLVEFPPHAISIGEITDRVELLNPGFKGRVYDYAAVAASKIEELALRQDPRYLPGVMPAWDNEARKPGAGHVFHNPSPLIFSDWIGAALHASKRLAPVGERLVFINAWNEWAEGAYLEPDRWFGHAFAHGVRRALEDEAPKITNAHPAVAQSHLNPPRHPTVALLHLHYPELIEDFAERLAPLQHRVDVAITFSDHWTSETVERLAAAFPNARLDPVANIGRDVAPFIQALRQLPAPYSLFVKLHSKRSPHTADGDDWRSRLVAPLIDVHTVDAILARFEAEPKLGLLAGAGSKMRLGEHAVLANNRQTVDDLARRFRFTYDDATPFVAGTMFWGRVAAFQDLIKTEASDLMFEKELGRIDGTLAHAFERAFAAMVLASGHTVEWSL